MKASWAVLGGVGLLILALIFAGGSFISAKNQMVAKDQNVKAAFSEIDINLQRRADLIPNLVATVKGYAKVEETVLTSIANARAGLMTAQTPGEKAAANDRLNVAVLPLLRLQETYPDLKSNEQFKGLRDELAGTENRIGVARRRYNEAIRDYNTFIQQFPNSLFANFAGFHVNNDYFAADASSKAAPKVDFDK